MTDIFNEVDEEIRRDQMTALWRRYGGYFVAAAVLLVVAVAGYEGWKAYEKRRAAADAAALAQAVDLARQNKPADAAKAFSTLMAEGTSGFGALAGLRAGAAEASAGDPGLAAAAYDRVAQNASFPQLYRDLAALMAAYHRVDQADQAEMRRRLDPLTGPDGAWRHLARELLGLAALKAGDAEGARKFFAEVADDPTAPAGARGRAAELIASLKGKS